MNHQPHEWTISHTSEPSATRVNNQPHEWTISHTSEQSATRANHQPWQPAWLQADTGHGQGESHVIGFITPSPLLPGFLPRAEACDHCCQVPAKLLGLSSKSRIVSLAKCQAKLRLQTCIQEFHSFLKRSSFLTKKLIMHLIFFFYLVVKYWYLKRSAKQIFERTLFHFIWPKFRRFWDLWWKGEEYAGSPLAPKKTARDFPQNTERAGKCFCFNTLYC